MEFDCGVCRKALAWGATPARNDKAHSKRLIPLATRTGARHRDTGHGFAWLKLSITLSFHCPSAEYAHDPAK